MDDAALVGRELRRLEQAENFPVALRVLPRRYRRDLRTVYDTARLIDDAGDDPSASREQRLERLGGIEAGLRRSLDPAGRLPLQPFLDLIAANRQDQAVARYPSYDDLAGYCRLSANPVGRLVLAVFDVDDEQARQLSDDVCTALQLLEHCQDVAEDKRLRDRVYLPQDDLARFGVTDADLTSPVTPVGLRRAIAMQVDRAAALFESGPALLRRLHGAARLAVAGYVAGGLATADALRRCDYNVGATTPKPRGQDIARHAVRLLVVRR